MRPIHEISREITRTWTRPYYAALPYLEAMRRLETVKDMYGHDSGQSIVLRFLGNARTWKGPDARRIKAELKAHLS
jgi:hypothetical protein